MYHICRIKIKKWFHYGCVGVDSDVANYSWNCEFCDNQPAAAVNPDQANGFETQPSSSSSPLVPFLTTAPPVVVTATGVAPTNTAPLDVITARFPSTNTSSAAPTRITYQQSAIAPHQYLGATSSVPAFHPKATPSYRYAAQPSALPINNQQQINLSKENNFQSNYDCLHRQKML